MNQQQILKIYTDGATRGQNKKNTPDRQTIGAWAYIFIYGDRYLEEYKACVDTTNNIQELSAAINALKTINKLTSVPVVVYADSKYVVDGINKWIKGWKSNNWRTSANKPVANKELWLELDEQRERFSNIQFKHTAGHQNNGGYNDRADELCNIAMDKLQKSLEHERN